MPVSNLPIFPQAVKNYKQQILNADASTLKTVVTGAANGTKITGLAAASTDTSSRDVQIGITRAGTFYILGTATIPAGAGNSGSVPSVNLLTQVGTVLVPLPLDSDGNPYIFLADASDTLQAKSLATVTADKEIDLIAMGSEF